MSVDFARLKVLVVDDQLLIRTLMTQALRNMGLRPEAILQAADGAAAIRTLDIRQVDLVLCDIQMDGLDGIGLLKELRCGQTANPSNLPFIFLSGHADRSNVLAAARLHADGFIVKPPKPADVEKAIELAMTKPRPEADPFRYFSVSTHSGQAQHFSQPHASTLLEHAALDESHLAAGILLPLEGVKPGMVLARDLTNLSGHLLLPKGTRITATQLAALRNFRDRYGVSHLSIVEPDQPGRD
ncbi:response regulator [Pseudogulbenkiania ferrooxidans]|uniref:Response regulator receiver protein n=1 Tax=Pseudogulbenkiania ferrooxidans 2002 TaxID=279714 RepID=B9Z7J0_9NEIS|nr:response regulator [Pseudogulbenkiania ferrooxidans]EEG07126.1 response regulator receiver protein [Pseudogulbenkiania ferrooxidans 2002]